MDRVKMEESFQSRYCRLRQVPPERFRADLLAHALYPHARPLVPLLRWADPQFFQPDHEFIDDMGRLRNLGAFHDALEDYLGHYANRRMLRHRLRLRISARRMWMIARQILPGTAPAGTARRMAAPGSGAPFAQPAPRSSTEPPAKDKTCDGRA